MASYDAEARARTTEDVRHILDAILVVLPPLPRASAFVREAARYRAAA
jgi:predicted RNA binding protein with dsRBD fold (UPF0201 family)